MLLITIASRLCPVAIFHPTLYFVFVLLLLNHSIIAYDPLSGVRLISLNSKQPVDLVSFLTSRRGVVDPNQGRTCYSILILGTYPADFNCIEYGQRLRYYLPELRKRGVVNFGMVVNGDEQGARTLAECIDLPLSEVEIFLDPTGIAGRAFGVERGWRPDDDNLSPYLKLFGMLWGLGAWATLPCVIGGYIGNPFRAQPWIEDAMAVGQIQKRWPNTALELQGDGGKVVRNKFSELPVVGGWKRRPLELATLRLQNMLGISISRWDQLKPTEEGFQSGVLTQLGGCLITETTTTTRPTTDNTPVILEWRDPGICAVANFEDLLEKLP
jgi:hypothetical protein